MTQNRYFRPLITSLAFQNQSNFLPYYFNYSLEQIQSIKKYLPKNLFKFHGVDINKQISSKQQSEYLQKSKIKIKAKQSKSIQTNKPLSFCPKQEVKMIEWYNKLINLTVWYSSKDSDIKVEALIFEHVNNYLENNMFFKNTLSGQLYKNGESLDKILLTTDQISIETDIIFTQDNIQPNHNENMAKIINLKIPILLCLDLNEKYSLNNLKQILKADIVNSISIFLKHNFNTRVIILGEGQKQFICLSSYCQEENGPIQQDKLRGLIHQNRKLQSLPVNASISKKQNKFLLMILIFLVVIYILLKIYPIHGKDQNMYIKNINDQRSYTSENIEGQFQQQVY